MTVPKNRARRHSSGTAERQSRRRQAADDEPLSHADKARGVSCKVQIIPGGQPAREGSQQIRRYNQRYALIYRQRAFALCCTSRILC